MTLYAPEIGEKVVALLQTEHPGMVTGMHIVVEYIDTDGEQRNYISAAPGQTMSTTNGLLSLANAIADYELVRSIEEGMRDE